MDYDPETVGSRILDAQSQFLELTKETTHLMGEYDVFNIPISERIDRVSFLAAQFIENEPYSQNPLFVPGIRLYVMLNYALRYSSANDKVQRIARKTGLSQLASTATQGRGEIEQDYVNRLAGYDIPFMRAFIHGECRYMLNPQRLSLLGREQLQDTVKKYGDRVSALGMEHVRFEIIGGVYRETTLIWNGYEIAPYRVE